MSDFQVGRPLHFDAITTFNGFKYPKAASKASECSSVYISVHTIRNMLIVRGLSARTPAYATPPSRRHRRICLRWSRACITWNTVLFTGDIVFRLSCLDRLTRVWRRKNERFTARNILEHGPYVW